MLEHRRQQLRRPSIQPLHRWWCDLDESDQHSKLSPMGNTAGNNYGGRQFSRSIDGGVTWMNPINIPNSPQWGTPDVDSTGNLFIGGVNVNTGQVWCIRSTNAKNEIGRASCRE